MIPVTTFPPQPAWHYPAEAFPALAATAIREVHAITQAPIELVSGVALSAMALAVQDIVNVRRRKDLVSGCSLFLIDIADSGERKTTVQRKFFEPFLAAQTESEESFEIQLDKYHASKKVWDVESKALERKLCKAIEKGRFADDIKYQITNHVQNQPTLPKSFRYIYNDITPEDFLYKLYTNNPSAGIVSDEAGRIFSSRLADDLGLLNKVWDGDDVRVDRRTSESFAIKSVRVSLSWLVQEAVFQKFMERKGDEARGIGFLARCLISRPVSTQGSRFIQIAEFELEHLPKFHTRIRELLRDRQAMNVEDGKEYRTLLCFSPEAQTEWVNIYNQIETQIQPGGAFCQNRDYASKIADNIARIAAVFHAFQGYGGLAISVETLRSATAVALWYAQQFIALFSPDLLVETIKDAVLLEAWIVTFIKSRIAKNLRYDCVEKNYILQYGPNSLRSSDRLRWVLNCLLENGRIFPPASPLKKVIVMFNMTYFEPMSRGIQPSGFYPLR
jgi:hypothetical protein